MKLHISQMVAQFCVCVGLVCVGLLLASCSGSDDSAADSSGRAESPAATEVPVSTATAVPTATTEPTPTPSPTPAPAPPAPDPIFTRVDLPTRAATDPARSLWAFVEATDQLPLVGIGHEYTTTDGRSVPIVWSIQQPRELAFDYLPLPDDASGGFPTSAVSALGGQIAGGRTRHDSKSRATYWYRDATTDWNVDSSFLAQIGAPDYASSWISNVEAADDWVLIDAGVESPTETNDDGDPLIRNHILIGTSFDDWQLLELPGVNPEDWWFGIHVDGNNGFIVAASRDDAKPELRFFVSENAGETWGAQIVELVDDEPAIVHDVLWDNGDLILVGSSGISDERDPAIFIAASDGAWRVVKIELELGDLEPFTNGSLQAVERLDESSLVAVLDTDPGNQTLTSTDGTNWQIATELKLNDFGNESAAFKGFVRNSEDATLLVSRGFDPPVKLTQDGVRTFDRTPFDRINRELKRVVYQPDLEHFVAITGHSGDSIGVQLWQSDDGGGWDLMQNDPVHEPKSIGTVNDAIFSWGVDVDNFAQLRIYAGEQTTVNLNEIFNTPNGAQFFIAPTAPAWGRNLIAVRVTEDGNERLNFGFIDLDTGGTSTMYAIDGNMGDKPRVVCPQLLQGAIAVVIGEADGLGGRVETWTNSPPSRLGAGLVPSDDDANFERAVINDCGAIGAGLALVGSSCSPAALALSEWSNDECDPQIWISDDALSWSTHPQSSVLTEAGVGFLDEATGIGPGAVVRGHPIDGDDVSSLWLVTAEQILPIPIDDIMSLTNPDIDHVTTDGSRILIMTNTEIFVGDLDYLLERTLPDKDSIQAWKQATAALDALSPPENAEAGVSEPSAPVAPAPTTAPAQPAAPAPTAVPAPTAASEPRSTPAPPVITRTDTRNPDGSISITIEVEQEVDG